MSSQGFNQTERLDVSVLKNRLEMDGSSALAPLKLHFIKVIGLDTSAMLALNLRMTEIRANYAAADIPMRVLVLSDHLGHAEGRVHGATTYFINTLPELGCRNIKLSVCFLRGNHPATAALESKGVKPIFLGRSKWDPRALADIIHIIRKEKIEVLHAAGMKGIILGRLAARITGTAIIVHLHDTNPLDPVTRLIHKLTARWTNAALCVSKAVAEYAGETLAIPHDKLHVLYNGVPFPDDDCISEQKRNEILNGLSIQPNTRVVSVVGRLRSEKAQDRMITAFPRLLKMFPNACLLLIGDGPDRYKLKSRVKTLNLEKNVVFAGHRNDLPELLACTDVLAMPSEHEGLPYSVLEAMASGTPVVAFAVGGLPEIIHDNETGFLVKPGDFDDFVDRLYAVLTNRELAARLGAQSLRRAQSFSVSAHVDELSEFYKSARQ